MVKKVKHQIFCIFFFAFCKISVILYDILRLRDRRLQPRGVMVAQVILVHFVEVRILTGLPFFLP